MSCDMKIGIVSNLYPPHERGGAELVARRIADELSKRGHSVSVLTTQPFSGWKSFSPTLQERHVERVYRFCPLNIFGIASIGEQPLWKRLVWHVIDVFSPGIRSVLNTWIQEEQPDVVVTHNLKGIGLSIGRVVQSMGVRHIHTLHDVQLTIPSGLLMWGEEQSIMNRSFLRRWYERLTKWAIGTPDVVISPSAFLLDFYTSRGFFVGTKSAVIPNPEPSVLVPNRSETRTGPIRLLFAGQLEPHKGILFLLRTLERVNVPIELHIAGDGCLREEIEERCLRDARLTYHGFVALDPLLKLIAGSDAVVVPSLCYENSPTIIYESFAVGTPVIASRLGGIPELIQEGKNGWTFDPGNEMSLLHAIESLAHHSETVWANAPEIRAHAEQYSLHTYVDVLIPYLKN